MAHKEETQHGRPATRAGGYLSGADGRPLESPLPPQHVALFIRGLSGGGVQRSTINLAGALVARGLRVDLVVGKLAGPSLSRVPPGVRLFGLVPSFRWRSQLMALRADPGGLATMSRPVLLPVSPPSAIFYLPSLVAYLRRERPEALIAADTFYNLVALWARRLAGVPPRVIVSERNSLSGQFVRKERRRKWRWRYAPALIRRVYPWADAIIAVSHGVGADLARTTGLPPELITTIYNPVSGPELLRQASAPLDHPWFTPGSPPVVLGVGRLVPPKDFATLVRAFARIRAQREARLVILGEEEKSGGRASLIALAEHLGVAQDVALPGFAQNPFAYMARAAVFVLASRREGLGNALIEALACGCPVVSTDCPSGPAEILEGGAYGPLVPVGDPAALAEAVLATLDDPPDPERLRARAAEFTIEHAAERYLRVLLGEGAVPRHRRAEEVERDSADRSRDGTPARVRRY